ncbi:F-box only protein 39 [Biomphalaria glabrata]|nr:F-box only protein 39-like [Biomphalaria glabrata]
MKRKIKNSDEAQETEKEEVQDNAEVKAKAPKRRRKFADLTIIDEPRLESKPESSYWDRLPFPIGVEICRYLNNADRSSMSRVCRAWYNIFKDPSLWRKKQFLLGGPYSKVTSRKTLRFTTMFGSCLQEARIVCYHRTSNTCKIIYETMEKMMDNMTLSKLNRLDIKDLELDRFYWKYSSLRDKVTECLVKMFQLQNNLKHVRMELCQFTLTEGAAILNALLQSSGHNVCCLHLLDYFDSFFTLSDQEIFTSIISNFTNLKNLSLNYCYISNELLMNLSVVLKDKLKCLTIRASVIEDHYHVITPWTWKLLNASCPAVKVRLSLLRIADSETIIPMLAQGMPLSRFSMTSEMESAFDAHLSQTLTHLVHNFQLTLEEVNLHFNCLQDSVDNELISIVQQCRNLKTLRVMANAGVVVANAICTALKDRRQLRKVEFTVNEYSDDPNSERLRSVLRNIQDMLNEVRLVRDISVATIN